MRYEQSNELEELIRQVIEENPELEALDVPAVRIVCQWCNQEKKSQGKRVYADTTVVQKKYKQFIDCDFVITFYRPNCDALDAEHMKRLAFHELLHCGYEDEKHFIVPHDFEDFRECVNRWGADWIKD